MYFLCSLLKSSLAAQQSSAGISGQIIMSLIFEISDSSFLLYLYFLRKFRTTSCADSDKVVGLSLYAM